MNSGKTEQTLCSKGLARSFCRESTSCTNLMTPERKKQTNRSSKLSLISTHQHNHLNFKANCEYGRKLKAILLSFCFSSYKFSSPLCFSLVSVPYHSNCSAAGHCELGFPWEMRPLTVPSGLFRPSGGHPPPLHPGTTTELEVQEGRLEVRIEAPFRNCRPVS